MSDNFLHVDPLRQRQFIENLNRRLHNIGNLIGMLDSSLGMLSRDWRDAEFDDFRRSTVETRLVLKSFIEEGRTVSRSLADSAEDGENYQKIRR